MEEVTVLSEGFFPFFYSYFNLEVDFPPSSVCEGCKAFPLSSLFMLLTS